MLPPPPSGNFVIATATDATMEELAIGLCRSLGPAARDLRVIDIGMSATARAWFAGQGVPVIDPPGAARPAQALDRSYFAAMYLRPHLPRILGGRLILWIDADCWVQDAGAIDDFRRAAIAAPAGIAACAMIDPDYDGCITNLVADQDWYRGLHRPLFGEDGADFLYGRAVLSSGVFCARADAPFWSAWEAQVRRIYDELRPAGDIGHMAEQCAFNMVLHQAGGFGLLRSENNWHCHAAAMERRGARVVVARSGRAPRIVHLSAFRGMEADYRAQRLLFEPAPATAPPIIDGPSRHLAALLDEVAALRGAHAVHQLELAGLRADLSDRKAQIATLRGTIEDRHAEVAALGAALSQQQAEVAALGAALSQQQAEAAALRASLSWRVTAPLRALRRRLAPP